MIVLRLGRSRSLEHEGGDNPEEDGETQPPEGTFYRNTLEPHPEPGEGLHRPALYQAPRLSSCRDQ